MTRTLWIFLLFIGGAAGLMIFNITVLGLGDPKFPKGRETALGVYLPMWLVFYAPHIITGWLMLTAEIPASRSQTNAFIGYTFLILLALEISFLLDAKLAVLAIEWMAALFIAWLIRRWLLGVAISEKA